MCVFLSTIIIYKNKYVIIVQRLLQCLIMICSVNNDMLVKLYSAFHAPLREENKEWTKGKYVRPVATGGTLRQILLFLRLRPFPEASGRCTLSLPGHPVTTAKAHLPH